MEQLASPTPLLRDDETSALWFSGESAFRLLQGQLSQDLSQLGDGEARCAFVLKPRGQVVALVHAARVADEYLLTTESSASEALLQHLKPHLSLSRVSVRRESAPWRIVMPTIAEAHFGSVAAELLRAGKAGVLRRAEGITLLCDMALGVWSLAVFGAPAPGDCLAQRAEVDAWRIIRGEPRFGIDIFENTLPAESGLEARTVSFTKGCYCGQEVVAKQHWLGRPRQKLVHFRFTHAVSRGDVQAIGTHTVTLSSVAEDEGVFHALGLVPAAALGTLPADAELAPAAPPVNSP